MGKASLFHFYSDEGMGKIRQEERNETVLHGRIELVDLRDILFSIKYHESISSQLFSHKHSATRYKYRGEVHVLVYLCLWMYLCLYVFASVYIKS